MPQRRGCDWPCVAQLDSSFEWIYHPLTFFAHQSLYSGDTVAERVDFAGVKGRLPRTHDAFFHYFPWSCVAAVVSGGGLFGRTGPKVKCDYFGMLRTEATAIILHTVDIG